MGSIGFGMLQLFVYAAGLGVRRAPTGGAALQGTRSRVARVDFTGKARSLLAKTGGRRGERDAGQTEQPAMRNFWVAAIASGIIAGSVFIVLEMILWPLAGLGSPWAPLRMIAAILLGPAVLPPPDSFHAGIVLVAMLVHFSLSILYATIYAAFYRWVLLRGRLQRLAPYAPDCGIHHPSSVGTLQPGSGFVKWRSTVYPLAGLPPAI